MDVSLVVWLLCAVLLCWCVGLYQRLLRLRLGVQQALTSLEQPLAAFGNALSRYVTASDTAAQAAVEWRPLLDATRALTVAGQAARNAPFAALPLQQLGQALDRMNAAWAVLVDIPAELLNDWQQAEFEMRAARAQFNQQIADYNAALQQFPARLAARPMGFRIAPTF